ncbi:MAG: bifunctional homocysteine S-methyltransferase/methylenetetrahydrofolate reductase [Clostridia bacterium]
MNLEITEYLKENVLLFDGAMGTYFSSIFDDPSYKCEYANITSPNTIREIHRRYLNAGAKAIKTNTFSLFDSNYSDTFDYKEIIKSAYSIASKEALKFNAFVFANIGHISALTEEDMLCDYKKVVDEFILQGATCFLFETLHEIGVTCEIARYIKEKVSNSYIIVCFAINSEGFTKTGEFRDILIENMSKDVDCVGFNCICAPLHMGKHIASVSTDKPLIASPNASYPRVTADRVRYQNNPTYFAKEMIEIAKNGAKIIGGCCGTTPEFISQIHKNLVDVKINKNATFKTKAQKEDTTIKTSDFYRKLKSGEKPIAVELDSPVTAEISAFMRNAKLLGDTGVDLITIADCPAARPRMDSSLVACKVRRELNIHTMPHLTCRDRNINASRALLLGLNVEDINDILIITGDPIPSELRNEVKSVYEFNSRKLINHINILNDILFDSPFYLYGALNINAVNFNAQLKQAKEKVEKGAVAFFTQPVLNERAFENLKIAKNELNVPIVGGVMPIVSYKNACFINNEISGIDICDEIVNMYIDKNRAECEEIAFNVTCEICDRIKDYIDGYYIITPFTRGELVAKIVKKITI